MAPAKASAALAASGTFGAERTLGYADADVTNKITPADIAVLKQCDGRGVS